MIWTFPRSAGLNIRHEAIQDPRYWVVTREAELDAIVAKNAGA